jgi:hypothetical protein
MAIDPRTGRMMPASTTLYERESQAGGRFEAEFADPRGLRRFVERIKLHHIGCTDATERELEEYRRDHRCERERERKRRRRAEQALAPVIAATDPWDLLDRRAQALAIGPLADFQWWTVRELADDARYLDAFQSLEGRTLQRVTLRKVRKLEVVGIVETKTELGPRDLKVTSVRRIMRATKR